MKIVLAIDGSEFSKEAVRELVKMPLPLDSEVCVLNVYKYPTVWAPELLSVSSTSSYYLEALSNAEKLVKKSAEKIVSEAEDALKNKKDVPKITTSVVIGLPKNAILEKAETFGADLIVVGAQGHGAFSSLLLGSVSQSIVTHANCSVMIARKKDKKSVVKKIDQK